MDLELRAELLSKDHNVEFSDLVQEVKLYLVVIFVSSIF